jgi:hypothetical protein
MLIVFWGEQKPVAAFVATGFNFIRGLVFQPFMPVGALTAWPHEIPALT